MLEVRRTHVLHVSIQTNGYELHKARQVDTQAQAIEFANAGHAQDEVDGAKTTYELYTWLNLADVSKLVSTREL